MSRGRSRDIFQPCKSKMPNSHISAEVEQVVGSKSLSSGERSFTGESKKTAGKFRVGRLSLF